MTTRVLHLSKDLTLPLDAATQTFAFIARKGAGKTYTAGKLVEQLLKAHVQVVILDTVGNWYGLRMSADGKGTGFDVPVLGGLRGDIPLEAAGGALIADIVVDTGRSMVIDASQWSKSDRQRFAAAFGERLWLRKKGEKRPAPVHLVIEESQLIVPQDVRGDTATMVGIYEEIIRLGRNYGIGVSMITQRPQSVNKEVLNQTECLFVGQVNGAQERDALKKWITTQGMDVHLVEELPTLKIGTFYVWSPQWLNLLQKVQILPKETFDASATPKVGDTRVRRELKPLDLADLQAQLKTTIEKAKADDPRELRRQIAELKAAVAKAEKQPNPKISAERQPPKPVLTDADRAAINHLREQLAKRAEDLDHYRNEIIAKAREQFDEAINRITAIVDGHRKEFADRLDAKGFQKILAKLSTYTPEPMTTVPRSPVARRVAPPAPSAAARPARQISTDGNGDASIGNGGLRRILVALARRNGMNARQLALRSGMSVKGGSFRTYLSQGRTNGWIIGDRGRLEITAAGVAALGAYEPLPEGEALQAYWLRELGDSRAAAMLRALCAAYPKTLTKEELAAGTNMTLAGGSFRTYLSRLRTLELIEGKSELRASEELFS